MNYYIKNGLSAWTLSIFHCCHTTNNIFPNITHNQNPHAVMILHNQPKYSDIPFAFPKFPSESPRELGGNISGVFSTACAIEAKQFHCTNWPMSGMTLG